MTPPIDATMASWRAYVARARQHADRATLDAWRNMAARTCAPCSAVLVESDMALWRAMPPADRRPADQCYLCGGALASNPCITANGFGSISA